MVSYSSTPVPLKIATKIWNGEFVDLNFLLPFCLGAPEPTIADTLQGRTRDMKQITSIQQWVVCFNAFISVVAIQQPQQIRDLLAYSSLVVKAANDYQGNPWLSYDVHFRTLASSMGLQTWGKVDQALWSQHFNRASTCQAGGDAPACQLAPITRHRRPRPAQPPMPQRASPGFPCTQCHQSA